MAEKTKQSKKQLLVMCSFVLLFVGFILTVALVNAADRPTILKASDGKTGDYFGYSVAIEGNRIVVGATGNGDNGKWSGSAYVFEHSGSAWKETKLLPSSGGAGDCFGHSVAIDGERIVVGAYRDDDNGDNSGSVYVFEYSGNAWQETKLMATGGEVDDQFGSSVAITGNRIVVGAYCDDDNGEDSGSAYVYEFINNTWQETKITPPGSRAEDFFGTTVAMDNNKIIVNGREPERSFIGKWLFGDKRERCIFVFEK